MAKKKSSESKKYKVRILAHNMAGKYLLPFNPGQEVEMEAKQAQEVINAGDAEKI